MLPASSIDSDDSVIDENDTNLVADKPTKKRKRETSTGDELEIDVNLPEPPSKKALRALRKGKKTGTEESNAIHNGDTTNPLISPPLTPAASNSKPLETTIQSVWIGNLPFTITKALLRNFLTSSSTTIADENITRINIPAPQNAKASKTTLKPQNKGFAYVDFSTPKAFEAALALSETQFGGRNLLIKDAKSFAGRPDKPKDSKDAKGSDERGKDKKEPSRRVFVGNLGFDVTKEDLSEHFAPCGEIENIHMATFEDSGKCKGFGWVTFAAEGSNSSGAVVKGEEAAGGAVRGWVFVSTAEATAETSDNATEEVKPDSTNRKKQTKPRKWFVNRLQGRPLRCEFAEDPSTRYVKRFGSKPKVDAAATDGDEAVLGVAFGEVSGKPDKRKRVRGQVSAGFDDIQPGAPTDRSRRRGKSGVGATAEAVIYRTGAIADATGTKVKFG